MNSRYFISHPVFALVISIVIVLMGGIALKNLPVEQFPDIAPPTVYVFTSYPGANAETVKKAVLVPLEESINGVEKMTYMTSTASNDGSATINVYFEQGTDADMATINVQNRIQSALGLLPAEVTKEGVTASKQQNAELMTFALYSPDDTYDCQFIDNYMAINVEPRLKRIAGVGGVMSFGSNYAMRVWLDPERMAQYKLNPSDINAVLEQQNIEAAAGALGEEGAGVREYTMKYRGRFSTPEEFGNLVIRSLDGGQVLRLKDVARVELGSDTYKYFNDIDGHAGTQAIINQKAGSNASAAIRAVKAELDEISKTMPKGLEFVVLNDSNRFLDASIKTVVQTLIEAILLVILVVFVFLQDLRSTVIPSLSIVVSIVGTFIALQVAGFTVNLLTLFALVLAIGTVVDDAIIVVEAVQARFDEGYQSAYLATNDAMRNVSGAIITSTFIFMAVFIPTAFMGGTSGEFYKQFGITMAVAVGISAINAFTLSPALCAIIMRPHINEDGGTKQNFAARLRTAFNAVFDVLTRKYLFFVRQFLKRNWLLWSTLAVGIALLAVMVRTTKTGLVPDEDSGALFLSMTTPPGTSASENVRVLKTIKPYLDSIPEIEHKGGIGGFSFMGSGSSTGMYFLTLRPWDERKATAQEVMNRVYEIAPRVPGASMMVDMPPLIQGYGMGSGFELYLQDHSEGDIDKFKEVADKFVSALNKRPEIGNAMTSFETNYPQYWVDVDAARCMLCGVTPAEVLETMAAYYGGSYASNFNRFSKLYRVQTQLPADKRIDASSLEHTYIRTASGEMAPLSQFVTLTKTMGTMELSRFNLYNSISISGSAAAGYSSGEALKAIAQVAKTELDANYGYELGGLSREEAGSQSNVVMIFALCLVLVYLILCALYESFMLPFAVVLTVPVGLMGSFLAAQVFGLENNIYMQTGIIMLIGLLAKTAILITEYALHHRKQGSGLVDAAMDAARERLRPILMTVLSMVFGLLPLAVSTGVGANGNRTLGITVVMGMIVGTLALLFMVPALFVTFRTLHEKLAVKKK